MKTPMGGPTPARLAAVMVVAALAGACSSSGSGGTAASPSRVGTPAAVASASPSPAPVTNALGVLFVSPLSGIYTVSLMGIDGRVVASAQANRPVDVSCANAAAAVVPLPVSTSNTRVYFMDDTGVVRFLAANGDAGRATTVPAGTPTRRSMFAVSPDDQRIAVIVVDFTSNGASTRLYVEDLNGGGHHLDTFSDSGAYTLWPTGWHGTNNLVVAKVPACTLSSFVDRHGNPQEGGPFSAGPQEFHVVDPSTAVRRFTVGGPTCIVAGAPSPAGVVCENDVQASVVNWTGATIRSFSIQGKTFAHLSPNGSLVAIASGNDTLIQESSRTFPLLPACGWIDDTHVFSGGDAQHQPRVGDVTSGNLTPIAAQGDCAGRIPGGL